MTTALPHHEWTGEVEDDADRALPFDRRCDENCKQLVHLCRLQIHEDAFGDEERILPAAPFKSIEQLRLDQVCLDRR